MNTVKLKTECGDIVGLDNGSYVEFRGIKYADAGRWEYPVVTNRWDGVYDATVFGDCCYQHRGFENDAKVNPFYHREFRRGMSFTYSEDCQYLNISAPKNAKNVPFCCIYTAVLLRAAAQTRGISAVRHMPKMTLFLSL